MALPLWLLISAGGRRSQCPGLSPTLGSLKPSHQWCHKSRVSLRVLLCPWCFRHSSWRGAHPWVLIHLELYVILIPICKLALVQWTPGHWHYERTLHSRRPLRRDRSFYLSMQASIIILTIKFGMSIIQFPSVTIISLEPIYLSYFIFFFTLHMAWP